MKLDQLDLALIVTALHTEREKTRRDEWLNAAITDLLERIGRALEATASPETQDGEEKAQQRSTE